MRDPRTAFRRALSASATMTATTSGIAELISSASVMKRALYFSVFSFHDR